MVRVPTHRAPTHPGEMLREEFPGLKSGYLEGALWGTGYYAATVGYQNNEAAVKAYVSMQGKKTQLKNYRQMALFD